MRAQRRAIVFGTMFLAVIVFLAGVLTGSAATGSAATGSAATVTAAGTYQDPAAPAGTYFTARLPSHSPPSPSYRGIGSELPSASAPVWT